MATSFSSLRTSHGDTQLRLADVVDTVHDGPLPLRFTAYDGSATGPADAELGLHVRSARGAAYVVTAPGSLGLARGYVNGDLELVGVHPGDPYPFLRLMVDDLRWARPDARTLGRVARAIGLSNLVPPPPPPQEALPDWRRA